MPLFLANSPVAPADGSRPNANLVGLLGNLIFVNVPTTDSLEITPAGGGVSDCALLHDVPYPVIAKTVTYAEVACTPTP